MFTSKETGVGVDFCGRTSSYGTCIYQTHSSEWLKQPQCQWQSQHCKCHWEGLGLFGHCFSLVKLKVINMVNSCTSWCRTCWSGVGWCHWRERIRKPKNQHYAVHANRLFVFILHSHVMCIHSVVNRPFCKLSGPFLSDKHINLLVWQKANYMLILVTEDISLTKYVCSFPLFCQSIWILYTLSISW